MSMIREYFAALPRRCGQGWNRFWFAPSDPFTLGALRLATGLLAFYLIFTFSFDLTRYFAADGLLPTDEVQKWVQFFPDTNAGLRPINQYSYLNYLTSPGALWTAHILGLIVLALFTVGFKSRITSVLALLVVLSYMWRAPMLTAQVEPVVAMVMFYLCLGPCGASLSVDRWLAERKAAAKPRHEADASEPPRSSGATVVLRLIQVHLTAFYVMMALMKLTGGLSGPVWWTGQAMWWIVARPESSLVDFTWLANYPTLINAWTHAVVAFELGFSVLIWNRTLRPLVLGLAAFMWAGMALATGLIPFCLMMFVGGFAFVPGESLRRCFACCQRQQDKQEPVEPSAAAA